MITLEKLQNGNLKMIVNDKESFQNFIDEMIDDGQISIERDSNDEIIEFSGDISLSDLISACKLDISCNWMDVSNELSLTETDALSDDAQIDDDGNLTFGEFWFDPHYQIRPYWTELLKKGECEFQQGS